MNMLAIDQAGQAQPLRANKPVDYKHRSFMVVDDQSSARQSLRLCIQNMGGGKVLFGTNYNDALFRLKNGYQPDVVLLDYNLEGGRDGQQLFEQMRKGGLIQEETIVMMVTAERAYENVVAIVELVPDDYVLKPFTPERLRLRLDRIVAKKDFLQPYYRRKQQKDLHGALQALETLIAQPASERYYFDLLRLRAELLLDLADYSQAIQTYQQILAQHQFPWAKVGLARALARENRHSEARSLLEEITRDYPHYFNAFDLHATICKEQGDYQTSQDILVEVSGRTPRNYDRKRQLVEVAMLNGDHATARAVMQDILQNSLLEGDEAVAAHLNLARICLQAGESLQAAETLAAIPERMLTQLDDQTRLSLIALRAAADPNAAAQAFSRERVALYNLREPPIELGLDAVRAALATYDLDLATRISRNLLLNKHTRKAFNGLLAIFAAVGQESALREVQRQVGRQIAKEASRTDALRG